jgi:hypothetical protein
MERRTSCGSATTRKHYGSSWHGSGELQSSARSSYVQRSSLGSHQERLSIGERRCRSEIHAWETGWSTGSGPYGHSSQRAHSTGYGGKACTRRRVVETRGDFYAVLHKWTQRLRSNITATYMKGSGSMTLDVDILTAFYKGMVLHTDVPPRILTTKTAYLLFFDGGSRGNPGAGGSGSVL